MHKTSQSLDKMALLSWYDKDAPHFTACPPDRQTDKQLLHSGIYNDETTFNPVLPFKTPKAAGELKYAIITFENFFHIQGAYIPILL